MQNKYRDRCAREVAYACTLEAALCAIDCIQEEDLDGAKHYIHESYPKLQKVLWKIYERMQNGEDWRNKQNARDMDWVLYQLDKAFQFGVYDD